MKLIPLTQGKFAIVDDSDFEFLNSWKWYAHEHRKTFYAKRQEKIANGKQTTILMHRQILGMCDSKIHIDHEDGNGLNNQRNNLRIATHAQNCANRKSKEGSSSTYKGVSWYKKANKWRSQIKKDKKVTYLGLFSNEVDAAKAYNKEAVILHGEFAKLNVLNS